MRLRQTLISLGGFGLLVAAVMAADPRVREELDRLLWGGNGVTSWDNRAMDFGHAAMNALKIQGIENGPMMIFAVVGGVLFLLMLKA
jgi:hypothetical protein